MNTCLGQVAAALYYGPTPAPHAISRCEELLLEEGTGPLGRANVDRYLGGLLAMTGAVGHGRELVIHAAAAFDDLGQTGAARYCDALLADIELLTGNVSGARRALEALCAYCEESGDVGLLASAASWLARRFTRKATTKLPGGGWKRLVAIWIPTIFSLKSHGDRSRPSCSRAKERPRQTRCQKTRCIALRRRMR